MVCTGNQLFNLSAAHREEGSRKGRVKQQDVSVWRLWMAFCGTNDAETMRAIHHIPILATLPEQVSYGIEIDPVFLAI